MTLFEKLVLNTALVLGRFRPSEIARYVAADEEEVREVIKENLQYFDKADDQESSDEIVTACQQLRPRLDRFESCDNNGSMIATEADAAPSLEGLENARWCLARIDAERRTLSDDERRQYCREAETWLGALRWALMVAYGSPTKAPEELKADVKELEKNLESEWGALERANDMEEDLIKQFGCPDEKPDELSIEQIEKEFI